ncbi:hypothetical protein KM043_002909 [Ampulex compressa]|nr:hypothetical protein KM043_002909 [Ampulex compressa]
MEKLDAKHIRGMAGRLPAMKDTQILEQLPKECSTYRRRDKNTSDVPRVEHPDGIKEESFRDARRSIGLFAGRILVEGNLSCRILRNKRRGSLLHPRPGHLPRFRENFRASARRGRSKSALPALFIRRLISNLNSVHPYTLRAAVERSLPGAARQLMNSNRSKSISPARPSPRSLEFGMAIR